MGHMGQKWQKRLKKRQLLGDDACYYTMRHTFSATQRTFHWHCECVSVSALREICYVFIFKLLIENAGELVTLQNELQLKYSIIKKNVINNIFIFIG